MLEQKILLRDFTEHPALQGCIRESVGLPEENGIIMGKLRNICREILGSEAI